MSDYKAVTGDKLAAQVVKGARAMDNAIPAPFFAIAAECVKPDGQVAWKDGYHNVVVNQGKAHLLNRMWATQTASTAGCFLQLHSATTASNHVYSDISASRVTAYGNDIPRISLAATTNQASQTMSASYSFTNGTQTVLGGAVLFYTAATMSTNAATADVCEYSEGQFGTTRTVGNGDVLNVTLTVSFA